MNIPKKTVAKVLSLPPIRGRIWMIWIRMAIIITITLMATTMAQKIDFRRKSTEGRMFVSFFEFADYTPLSEYNLSKSVCCLLASLN